MQFFLIVIAAIGAYLIDRSERSNSRFWENPISVGKQAWVIVGFAIATLGSLVLSDGFAGSWLPLSSPTSVSIIGWHHALVFVFVADIVWTLILVIQTGGCDQSAFTSLFFTLPTLALFLREPAKLVIIYASLVAVCFSLGLVVGDGRRGDSPSRRFPFWTVSLLCLVLSVLIGLMTRPR
jgi:hypothetical protein